jgi:transposase-like protein
MTQAENRKQWAKLIQEYEASGQGVREWCEAHGLKPDRVWYWLRKHRSEKGSPQVRSGQWLPVEVAEQGPTIQDDALVVKVGSVSIQVRPGFDQALLTQVVSALIESC